jgi:hypothetical protein
MLRTLELFGRVNGLIVLLFINKMTYLRNAFHFSEIEIDLLCSF